MTTPSSELSALGEMERRIVWAVVRCLANALLTAAMFSGLLWLIICVYRSRLALEPLVPVVALVSLAASMEIASRGLAKRPG
jgi:hypothetical protein